MSRTRKVASITFTGAAAAAAIGFNVPRAAASSGTWHITPAGHFTGTATSGTTLVDHTKGITLTCPTATGSGSLPNASVTGTPATLGSISKATFGTSSQACAFAGVTFTATLNKAVNLVGITGDATGVTSGKISGSISATLTGVPGGGASGCVATITGTSVPAKYNNANHSLNINSGNAATLHVTTATSCPIIASGDSASFTANYKVASPASLTITDP